jgi:hypothetical protein
MEVVAESEGPKRWMDGSKESGADPIDGSKKSKRTDGR